MEALIEPSRGTAYAAVSFLSLAAGSTQMSKRVKVLLLAASLAGAFLAGALVLILARPAPREPMPRSDIGALAATFDASRLQAELVARDRVIAELDAKVAHIERRLDELAADFASVPGSLVGTPEAGGAIGDRESASDARLRAAVKWVEQLLPDKFLGLTLEEAWNLRELELQGLQVVDADLENLVAFSNLRRLSLRGTAVTDDGLLHLHGLNRLQHLDLRGTKVRGEGLTHVPPAIEALDLTDTQVTGEALYRLPRRPALRTLDLNRLSIGDEALEALGRCPALRHLELDGTSVSDEGIRRLLEINPGLERLELRDTAASAAAVRDLAAAHPGLTIVREGWPH